MNPEENKISVWVCREEKLVSGLSKRTTCGDVVKVLLEHQSPALLCASPQSYCIVEKWRGFERILPNKTKILRLWNAWGHEQENVRFVLVKSAASLPNTGPRSAEARVVASNESQKGPAKTAVTISQERQRRIVRKAFRKLEKINKKKEEEEEPVSRDSCGERMETLVHLVISQDHTIRQQVQRIKELDGEIERYESNVHFDRVKRHGTNYVQDTYLVERGSDGDPDRDALQTVAEAVTRFEEYANRCDQVLKLQEEIAEREVLLECLTGEIQEELNHRWMRRRQGELSGKDGESATEEMADSEMRVDPIQVPEVSQTNTGSESENQLEEERIKTQLDTSLYIGLRLNTDLEAIKNDLDLSQELWEAKQKELKDLLEKIDSLNECGEEDDKDDDAGQMPRVEENIGWVEEARGLSKTCSTNDDDSDTGLSSMHSQDSDNPPVCESLV